MLFGRRKQKKYENPFRATPRNISCHVWVVPTTLLLLAGAYALFFLPFWKLRTVVAAGNYPFDAGHLRGAIEEQVGGNRFGVVPKSHFFLVRRKALERRLQEEFPLAQVRVVKDWSSRSLRIYGIERPLFGYYFSRGLAFVIDRRGHVLSAAEPSPEDARRALRIYDLDLDIPTAPSTVLEDAALDFFSAIRTGKVANFVPKIWAFSKKDGSAEVTAEAGYRTIFNYRDAGEGQLAKLDQVLSHVVKTDLPKLDYIDLRFGEKVYYKLK